MKRWISMPFAALFLATLTLRPAAQEAEKKGPIFDTTESEDKGTVIPLGVESGSANDRGRDTRVFTVPVSSGDVRAAFIWSGSGQTVISASFATKVAAQIKENEDLKPIVGADGKPLFLGDATVELEFGGQKQLATAYVLRDGELSRNVGGMIGFDVAKNYQWEVDPRKPQVTLKRPGAPLRKDALASVPLTEDALDLSVHVKFRGVEEDLSLQPNASYTQAAEKLQQAWEGANVGKPAQETKVAGTRIIQLTGDKDGIALADGFVEQDLAVILLADGGTAKSGLGAAMLNRFVYVIDPARKQLAFLERVPPAPAPKPGAAAGK